MPDPQPRPPLPDPTSPPPPTRSQVYPKDNDQVDDKGDKLERGRDLFDAFRPCYIRAYTDAKDIMPDTGEKLEGTKSTADDFLSFGEFRYFNIFICAYAAMYDGFAKIDGALGGGASEGRDGDDLRMEKDEWLAGYKAVAGAYGFEGLKKDKLGDDDAAMVVFNAIDDNGAACVCVCACARVCAFACVRAWSEYRTATPCPSHILVYLGVVIVCLVCTTLHHAAPRCTTLHSAARLTPVARAPTFTLLQAAASCCWTSGRPTSSSARLTPAPS